MKNENLSTRYWNSSRQEWVYPAPANEEMALGIDNVLCSVLPGVHYMDPSDGGDVTPLEQVQRMAKDAARYRWLRKNGAELFYAVADLEGEALDAAVDTGREDQNHD